MYKILLVDDDDLVREALATSLTESGYHILQAVNGRVALAVLSRQLRVDAIVLDVMMPEMEGIETLREIQKSWPELPVIVMSGGGRSGWTDVLALASKLGASRTLSKPFSARQLIEVLEATVGGQRTHK